MKCPAGYSQHKAFLSDGCQILYCLQAGTLFGQQLAPLKLPPFLHTPSTNANLPETILVSSDSQAWVKVHQGRFWRPANASDVKMLALLFQEPSGPSGGAVAGISVGAVVALVLCIALLIYGIRHRRNRGYQEVQAGPLLADQGSYGGTEISPEVNAA